MSDSPRAPSPERSDPPSERQNARVGVDLGSRSYDILIGGGLIADAGRHIGAVLPGARVAIVSDENVAELHLSALQASLDAAGIGHSAILLPPGEASKRFDVFETVCDRVAIMLEGTVRRQGTPAELAGNPQWRLSYQGDAVAGHQSNDFRFEGDEHEAQRQLDLARQQGRVITHFAQEPISLEELFLSEVRDQHGDQP